MFGGESDVSTLSNLPAQQLQGQLVTVFSSKRKWKACRRVRTQTELTNKQENQTNTLRDWTDNKMRRIRLTTNVHNISPSCRYSNIGQVTDSNLVVGAWKEMRTTDEVGRQTNKQTCIIYWKHCVFVLHASQSSGTFLRTLEELGLIHSMELDNY